MYFGDALAIIMDTLLAPIHIPGVIIALPITTIHMARHIMGIPTSIRDMVMGIMVMDIMVMGIEFSIS